MTIQTEKGDEDQDCFLGAVTRVRAERGVCAAAALGRPLSSALLVIHPLLPLHYRDKCYRHGG